MARWLDAEGWASTSVPRANSRSPCRPECRGILFHGNNKSEAEIARALEVGVGRFVIDSFAEIARLGMLAQEAGVVAQCLVRVTVGVEAHTHEFIATAHEDQKFDSRWPTGSPPKRCVGWPHCRASSCAGCTPIGSQIFDPAGFDVAARRLVGFATELAQEGIGIEELNLGGGMGIAYTAADDPPGRRADGGHIGRHRATRM